MATDIRIPESRIEESRIVEYHDSLRPIQYQVKHLIFILTVASLVAACARTAMMHADKGASPVLHSKP